MNRIILIGAGGHAKSCLNILKDDKKFKIIGFVDNVNKTFFDFKYLGSDKFLGQLRNKYKHAVISVGQIKNSKPRKLLYNKLKKLNFNLPNIISKNSLVSNYTIMGDSNFIFNHVLINISVKIGNNCIINNKTNIEHDVIIGNNCHISTGCMINGNVTIGNDVFIGSGSIIFNNCKIGDNVIISAGSVIKNNVKKNSIIK